MRGLQIGVGFVECVAVAELGKRRRNPDAVLAHMARAPGLFVDVVTEMHDQIEIARGHVAIRGEVALLVLLA